MADPEYQPSKKIIYRYAKVLVNLALNSGKGLRPGEVVECLVPEVAKPLALALQEEILKAGGHPILRLLPTGGFEKSFFQHANKKQIEFFPKNYYKEKSKLINHTISIIAETDPFELISTDPAKIMAARNSRRPYRNWLIDKESQGKYTWTIALWATPAKANIVGLTLEQYWDQIIKSCFLDQNNPVKEWQKIYKLQTEIKSKLNDLLIEWLEMVGPDVNLKVKLGEDRIWNGGSGRNIPSFELFTSPDWRGTEGWIKFNQPVYRYGNKIAGVHLEFNKGVVTKATAKEGQKLLNEMLKTKDADKLGEFSLTDSRMSRIEHVMAETLFDENIGGPFGNTHVAIGMSYRDCFRGDPSKLKNSDWKKRGFNTSAEHTDFVSTTDRTVTATLKSGKKKVIYKNGQFTI